MNTHSQLRLCPTFVPKLWLKLKSSAVSSNSLAMLWWSRDDAQKTWQGPLSKAQNPEFRSVAKFILSLFAHKNHRKIGLFCTQRQWTEICWLPDSVSKLRVGNDFQHFYEADFRSRLTSSEVPKKRRLNSTLTRSVSIVMNRIATQEKSQIWDGKFI